MAKMAAPSFSDPIVFDGLTANQVHNEKIRFSLNSSSICTTEDNIVYSI